MNCLDNIEKKIKNLLKTISENGGCLYLVGGAVRDIIMFDLGVIEKRPQSKDFDFCITGLSQSEFEKIFSNAIIQGKDFPVYIFKNFPGYEFSLARKERKVGIGYRGFEILTSSDVTIEDDLIRRDLTINSIAYDFCAKGIVDPFGGTEDIRNKTLRAVSPAFGEDPLRVYRVAQFASRFSFDVEFNTIQMMKSLKGELDVISPERVFVEVRKAINSKEPSRFFKILNQAKVLEIHFPEMAKLAGQPLFEHSHFAGDAFYHTMNVLDKVSDKTDKEEIRFAALVHDIGKGETDLSLWPKHIGHDRIGAYLVGEMAKKLTYPKTWISAGKLASDEHIHAGRFNEMGPAKKVEFIEKVAGSGLGLRGLEFIVNADGANVEFADLGEKMIKEVNGKSLGVEEGLEAREIIHRARIEWLKNQKAGKEINIEINLNRN
ncbi:MAG: HD domain-containing protein [Ignavibacteriales bacterium]